MGSSLPANAKSFEFWSAADPEHKSCILNDIPRDLNWGPTLNLVSSRMIVCLYDKCKVYQEGSWQEFQNLTVGRSYHSSVTIEDALLLIGGSGTWSTAWIFVNGSASKPGPFEIRHGFSHCTIQVSDDVLVVTGGADTEYYATKYHLADGSETPLISMRQPRADHACGIYQDTSGQQVNLPKVPIKGSPFGP